MKRKWKDIEIEDVRKGMYEISTDGYVRNKITKRIMHPWIDKHGYPVVSLISDNPKYTRGRKNMFVHRLVAIAFIPNPLNKPEVNHKHGRKDKPCVEELEWATRKENIEHEYATGLSIKKGENNPCSTYKESTIRQICSLLQENGVKMSNKEICSQTNLDYNSLTCNQINRLKRRERWKHVCAEYNY